MEKNQQVCLDEILSQIEKEDRSFSGVLVGEIICVHSKREMVVDFPDNPHRPVSARVALSAAQASKIENQSQNIRVVLVFEKGDPSLPIIIGVLLNETDKYAEPRMEDNDNSREVLIDGKRKVFEAEEEIILRCGKSSLKLKKNGKIEIKGVDLITRSSGCNRIKGAVVKIN
jgi:hypothetical protein